MIDADYLDALQARPELCHALVDALSEFDELTRDKTANVKTDKGSYSYNYSDIGTVLGYVRPILAKSGLVVMQPVTGGPDTVTVQVIIVHTSGQSIALSALTLKAGGTPQATGSAITYARRYTLLAALGLATEDDDGKAASKPQAATRAPTRPRTATAPSPNGKAPSEGMTKRVMAQFGELGLKGDAHRDERLKVTSGIIGRTIGSWKEVTAAEAVLVTDALHARLEAEQPRGVGRVDHLDGEGEPAIASALFDREEDQ